MNQLEEFFYTVKSDRSKETYAWYIRYFEQWSKSTLTDLLKLTQKEIQDKLIKYVIFMRDKGLSHSTVKGRIAPIISFLELNDILVNKKKIKRFFGEVKRTVRDSAYTTEQIEKMLSVAKLRVKVIILIYSSTGIRRDALPELKLKDLQKIEEYGIYKIVVYRNSKEEYLTFTSNECANMIDQYLKHRKQAGESLNKESWLIRNDYNHFSKLSVLNPEPTNSKSLNTVIRHVLIKTGLRDENEPAHDRHDTPIFHGFRKFFTSQLVEANLSDVKRWLLEGHKLKGNDESYVRISEAKLLQEYLKGIDSLTISEENKLRKKVKLLQVENSQYEELKKDFEAFKQEVLNQRKR